MRSRTSRASAWAPASCAWKARDLGPGQRLRVQLLARDLILATAAPTGLSVRNSLEGRICGLSPDGERAWLVMTDIGGVTLMVRVTEEARRALDLAVGQRAWVLVKAVSLRGHVFSGSPRAAAPPA